MKRVKDLPEFSRPREKLKEKGAQSLSGVELIAVILGRGQEGIEVAQRELPDLILMDISLPMMDGWEATERIRKIDSIKNIPIIALTAHALVEDRNRSLAIGCNDFETKPINFSQLIVKIDALLGKNQKK